MTAEDSTGSPPDWYTTAQSYFDRGDSFMNSSLVLGNLLNLNTPGVWQQLGLPYVVGSTFATEMFLKALIFIETGAPADSTHNLIDLFDDLSDESQRWIHKQWEKRCRPTLTARKLSLGSPKGFPKSMRGVIQQASLAFVEWRYPNAPKILDWNLGDFPDLLRERIMLLQPTWRSTR